MHDSAAADPSLMPRFTDGAADRAADRLPSAKAHRLQAIFTADDFGAGSEINHSIDRAHRQGVLTAASLMVTGDAFDEAVAQARNSPSLAVGLHLALTDAVPVLPTGKIPHLVEADGRLPLDPAKMGLRLAASKAARLEMVAELRSQFEKFAETGLPLCHVDGHMHLHMHPSIFPAVVALALEFKAAGVRLPRERILPAVWSMQTVGISGVARTGCLAVLAQWKIRLLDQSGLKYSSVCCGVARTGRMDSASVIAALRDFAASRPAGPGSVEFIFHPTEGARRDALGANPGDLAALLDPAVREACVTLGVDLANYYTLLGNARST